MSNIQMKEIKRLKDELNLVKSQRDHNLFVAQQFTEQSEKLFDLLIEINDYLDYHKDNAIHSGSKLHMKIKEELK